MKDVAELERLLEAERQKRTALEEQLRSRTRELKQSYLQLEKANVTLALAGEYAEAIVNNVPSALIVLDATYRIVTINPTAERMFEVGANDILGQPAQAILNRDVLDLVQGSIELKRPLGGIDLAVLLPSCERLYVKLSVGPIVMPTGTANRILVVMDDITTRKRMESALRDSEGKFRGVIEHAADALFVYDEKKSLVDLNRAACESLGVTREHLLGRDDLRGELTACITPIDEWYTLTENEVITLEGEHIHVNDGPFPIEARVGCFHWRNRRHVVAIVRDITERKVSEANLSQLNEELRLAMHKAIEASAAKSEFLANMSHELRTPLNAIIGYTELITEEIEDLGADELIPDLDRIHLSANHLLNIINDILDLSKIEAGKVELFWEDVAVTDLINDVSVTINPLADKRGNTFAIATEEGIGRMQADRTKLRQSLVNLLGNACKFTEGGTVSLNTRREVSDQGDFIIFEVVDTGIGIDPTKLNTLFDAFTQADGSITRKYGGTGLGLAITKHFCQLMGGDIIANSVPGEGSSFIVRLPARTRRPSPNQLKALNAGGGASSKSSDDPETRDKDTPRGTILIVDDDPASRRLMRHYLSQNGYLCHTANNGQEALELALRLCPDVITLDVQMPVMDGWETLTHLKGDPELSGIPVIMVSLMNDLKKGFALGASEFLLKPVEKHRLISMVDLYLGANSRGSVMVVDDDPSVRDILTRILTREGYTVTQAANGRVALDQLEAMPPPDLILLDLMMPDIDGFGVLEALSNSPLASVPVVVVTAKDLTQIERDRLNTHVMGILEKNALDQGSLLEHVRDKVHTICSSRERA